MGEVVRFDRQYWKGFYLSDGKQRWLYTDEKSAIRLKDRDYFNKDTIGIVIYKGYETEKIRLSQYLMYYISIDYKIDNYFGDKSGVYFRSKRYVLVGDAIYKLLKFREVEEVERITKELKGALSKIGEVTVMNTDKNLLKEYEDIRGEIKQKMELHNSLITFMITTVVAVLAFALERDNPALYLLPFAIIIPISMRVTYYRTSMAKLSAYVIVYLEDKLDDINWETRNTKLINDSSNKLFDKLTISHYYEGIILGVVCYVLYFIDYINGKLINTQTVIFLIMPIFLIIWEGIITKRMITFDNEKNKWMNIWKDFKNKNG